MDDGCGRRWMVLGELQRWKAQMPVERFRSVVDTGYDACGCSPLGKISKQSQPYAPGGTVYWTTYTYDGLGRTLTAVAPDGSQTSYSYVGKTVTVTALAGKGT